MCSDLPAANIKRPCTNLPSRKLRCNFSMLFICLIINLLEDRAKLVRVIRPFSLWQGRRLPLPTDANLTVISMFTLCSVLLGGGGGVRVQKGAASKLSSPIATGNELTQKYPELGLSTPRLFMQFISALWRLNDNISTGMH